MNKKSRKRACLVYVVLSLLYVVVAFRLPDKMSVGRISAEQTAPSKGMLLPVPDAAPNHNPPPSQRALSAATDAPLSSEPDDPSKGPAVPDRQAPAEDSPSDGIGQSGIEPSLLIAVPVVCYAVKQGWLEKEGLIFGKKDAYNNVTWKKPLEILKDHDEDGLRGILNTIGQKRVLDFMGKEGIGLPADLPPDNIILGKGYKVDAGGLLAMYDRVVGPECDGLFPFVVGRTAIVKGGNGFQMTKATATKEGTKNGEAEWMMPNLANLPMRLAIDRLSVHTTKIKVYGSGFVSGQSPKPFERLKGEQECIIQGRADNE